MLQFMARIKKNDKVHLAWCCGGVIGMLVIYGVLQVGGLERVACSRCNRLGTVGCWGLLAGGGLGTRGKQNRQDCIAAGSRPGQFFFTPGR